MRPKQERKDQWVEAPLALESCEDTSCGPCIGLPIPSPESCAPHLLAFAHTVPCPGCPALCPTPRLRPPPRPPAATWPPPPQSSYALSAPAAPGAPLDSFFLPGGGHLCSDTHLGSFWILLLGAGSAPHRAWQMFPRKNWLFNQTVCAGGQGGQRIGPTCPQEAPGHILEVPPHPCPPLRHTSPAPLLAGRLWGGGGG